MSYVVAGVAAAATIGIAYQQSQNIKANAEFNAQMGEMNAQMAEIDGAVNYKNAVSEIVRTDADIQKAKDAQLAAIASTGVEVSGSVKSIVDESNLNASLNVMDMEQQAQYDRLKFNREARNIRTQNQVNLAAGRMQAQNTMLSGYASAINIGLNAASANKKMPSK